jgi:hypothetical protein
MQELLQLAYSTEQPSCSSSCMACSAQRCDRDPLAHTPAPTGPPAQHPALMGWFARLGLEP